MCVGGFVCEGWWCVYAREWVGGFVDGWVCVRMYVGGFLDVCVCECRRVYVCACVSISIFVQHFSILINYIPKLSTVGHAQYMDG